MWLYPVPFDLHKVDKDPEACAPSSFSPGFVIRIEHIRRRLISCDDIHLGVRLIKCSHHVEWLTFTISQEQGGKGLSKQYSSMRSPESSRSSTVLCAILRSAIRCNTCLRHSVCPFLMAWRNRTRSIRFTWLCLGGNIGMVESD